MCILKSLFDYVLNRLRNLGISTTFLQWYHGFYVSGCLSDWNISTCCSVYIFVFFFLRAAQHNKGRDLKFSKSFTNHHHYHHHVPGLLQTSAIMTFQSPLSPVLLISSLLGDSFLVTNLFRLSVYFVHCLPLHLIPQIFPPNINLLF